MGLSLLDRRGHIFLSHSAIDTPAACQLAEKLRGRGLDIWLDKDDLQPGDSWMQVIEAAVHQSSAMIVYVGRLGVQHWVDREVRLGLVRNTKDPKFRIVPVLGEGANQEELPSFLQQHHYVDLRDKKLITGAIQRLTNTPRSSAATRSIVREYRRTNSPFRSLRPFEAGTHGCSSGVIRTPMI
jgi:hypothetical protein